VACTWAVVVAEIHHHFHSTAHKFVEAGHIEAAIIDQATIAFLN
jgi:hypothetical protein